VSRDHALARCLGDAAGTLRALFHKLRTESAHKWTKVDDPNPVNIVQRRYLCRLNVNTFSLIVKQ